MKKLIRLALILFVAVQLFADEGLRFTDSRGTIVALSAKPRRIVSLAPELTEILFAIGAGDTVVGVSTYCNYPAEAAARTKIGGFSAKTISVEAIVALKPDLVIGSPAMHGGLAEQFERAKLKFAAFVMQDFNAIYATIEQLGSITGRDAQAASLTASLKTRVAAVESKIKTLPADKRPLVFWEVWHEPLMTAGANTFISHIIEAAGGKNCFAEAAADWPTVSFESVLAKNPEYILSAKSHGNELSKDSIAKRQGWSALKAVKQNRVFLIEDDLASRAGPRFVDALELTAKILHPELFK